ncbi:MAG: HAD hydrolase-like protein, partial [Clostridia bacterium]|nr:HAD hydrolase-like protein [Clostridia bacterium]
MKKHVLFDLDGTIIDSSECIYWVYGQLFARYGLTMPVGEERKKFIGPPIETTIGDYVEPERVKLLCDDFHAIYKTVDLLATNRLYDGIKDALLSIKGSGRKIYIATSKNE